MITFTEGEITAMQEHPDTLRALADWHSVQATMADAIGPELSECVRHHEMRREELRALADEIEADY